MPWLEIIILLGCVALGLLYWDKILEVRQLRRVLLNKKAEEIVNSYGCGVFVL